MPIGSPRGWLTVITVVSAVVFIWVVVLIKDLIFYFLKRAISRKKMEKQDTASVKK
jgi:biopolymer transport protein ExbB/TolQ